MAKTLQLEATLLAAVFAVSCAAGGGKKSSAGGGGASAPVAVDKELAKTHAAVKGCDVAEACVGKVFELFAASLRADTNDAGRCAAFGKALPDAMSALPDGFVGNDEQTFVVSEKNMTADECREIFTSKIDPSSLVKSGKIVPIFIRL